MMTEELIGQELRIQDVLEMKYVLSIIHFLKEKPGATKTDLIKGLEANDRTIFLRLNDLFMCGIIDFDEENRKHNTTKIFLTQRGQELSIYVDNLLKFCESI